VRLTTSAAFPAFKAALHHQSRSVRRPDSAVDWYKKISEGQTTFFNVIAYGIGIIMAVGALFGCLNTMYAAVAARAREIATLRAHRLWRLCGGCLGDPGSGSAWR